MSGDYSPGGLLPELTGDAVKSLNRLAVELSEHGDQGKIPDLADRNLAEEYIGRRLCFVIKLDVTAGRDVRDVRKLTNSTNKRTILHRDDGGVIRIENGELIDLSGADYRHEDGMLLRVVELVEGIEGVSFTLGENLNGDQRVFHGLAGRFYSFARGFEVDPVIARGKFEVTILYTAVPANQRPGHVIEGTPKVVDSVAYYEGQFGRDVLSELDADSGLSRFWVTAYSQGIRVGINEGGKLPFKVADVMIGPFNL